MTKPLDEQGVARLMKENLREHTLGPEQRERLRVRLTDSDDPAASAAPDLLVIHSDDPVTDATRRPLRRRLMMGAAVVVAIASLAAYRGIVGDPGGAAETASEGSDQPRSASEEPACPAEARALLDGAAAWGGVETWSMVTDDRAPEPDLLSLALGAAGADPGLNPLADELRHHIEARQARSAITGDAPRAVGPAHGERRAIEDAVSRTLAETAAGCEAGS